MKFLLFILIIIDNLNVLLANNDNCRENDLNALMVRLRVLRTDFADLKTKHDELLNRIDLINNTQADLKEAGDNQETELKRLKQEINSTSSEINTENRKQDTELTKLRQEIDAIKEGILLKYLF
jgi:predicted  nucleic acid-binding Zn-ribbon protein